MLLNNLGNKHSLLMKFDQFVPYYKEKKIIKKLHKIFTLETSSRPCLQRIKHNLYWKMKLLKQATSIRYILAKLSNFVQISMQTSSDSFEKKNLSKKIL